MQQLTSEGNIRTCRQHHGRRVALSRGLFSSECQEHTLQNSVARRDYLRLRTLRRKFSPMGEKAKTSTMNVRKNQKCLGPKPTKHQRLCQFYPQVGQVIRFGVTFIRRNPSYRLFSGSFLAPGRTTSYDIEGLEEPSPTWLRTMCIFFMHCSMKNAITWLH